MPNRILRDGILTSEAVCSLSWGAEVLYRRLMSVADDHGRYYATPKLIRAACYPHQIDKVSDADIGKWITECVTAALVSVYPALDGKRYLEIVKFGQQVRSKSKFPDPGGEQLLATASKGDQLPTSAHLGVFVSEGVIEGECVDDKPAPRPSPTRKQSVTVMPEGFLVSDAVRDWAQRNGHTQLEQRLEHFRGYARANGKRYADWDQAFMNAIRDDWAKLNRSTQQQASYTRPTTDELRTRNHAVVDAYLAATAKDITPEGATV